LKRLKNIALWTAVLGYLVISLSFTGEKRRNTICSSIRVRIVDSLQDQFVTEKGIKDQIHELDIKVLGEPVKNINTKQLEQYLNEKENIRNTEVFFTADGDLHVEINQRNPIVRIINQRGQSYYIDEEGAIIPMSGNYSSHVLIAAGNIREFFEVAKTDWLKCPQDYEGNINYSLCEIYDMARFIHNHPFWESQIEQIYRNDKGEYELVPRVGSHLIILGEYERYREKFRNLKAFYEKGLNNVGWNQYLKINLKYDNQIICTKR
jgi:cell division protein FtsQ